MKTRYDVGCIGDMYTIRFESQREAYKFAMDLARQEGEEVSMRRLFWGKDGRIEEMSTVFVASDGSWRRIN